MDSRFQQVSRRLAGLAAKRPGFALGLWGEPGIGKTHTALALLRGAPCLSFTIHATQPLESLVGAIPYPKKASVWLERSLKRIGRGEPPEIGALVQTLAGQLAANAPVILHVEDLHEADNERLSFWTQLASRVARTRGIGLLATGRTPPPEGFEAIQLSTLNREASDILLEAEAGAELPRQALAWVFGRAAGNPLYTLEFFRFLARQGCLWNDGHRWRWRVPERKSMPVTVEALIERTLKAAASTPSLEDALNAKAVLGLGASESLWARVTRLTLEELKAARSELERKGVVSTGEFAHPLYREVLVRDLAPARRQALARLAIEALEDDPRAAAQFLPVAGLEACDALAWLERAAQAAKEGGNDVQSARFKANAVEYARGEVRAHLAFEAAQILQLVDLNEAGRLAELAASSASLKEEAVVLAAEILAIQGRLVEAERVLERLPSAGRDWERRVRWLKLRAMAREYAGAIDLWQQNPDLRASDDPTVLRAAIQAFLGNYHLEQARPLLVRALAIPNLSPSDRMAFESFEVITLLRGGETERAAALLAERIPALSAGGDARATAAALYQQAVCLERLGRLREAVRLHVRASDLYAEAGDWRGFAQARVGAAWQLWHLGAYEDSENLLLESREVLQGAELSDLLVECEGILSLMYLDWSPPLAADLAGKHARVALEIARRIDNPHEIIASLHDNAVVMVRQGQPALALVLADEMSTLCEAHGFQSLAVNALYCRALALDAMNERERALQIMLVAETRNEGGSSIFTQKIGIEIARMAGDLGRARLHLEWFASRGLANGVNILQRYFPELAQDRPAQTLNLEPELPPRLEVLGPMQVRYARVTTALRGGKRKELLALLLEARMRGHSGVTRLDLCDALYPLEPDENAMGALKATVFKVRSSLSKDLIATTTDGYALGAVTSDAEAFLQTGDTGLWRGAYLEDSAVAGRDENVREALHRALETSTRALLEGARQTRDAREAARLGRLLVLAEPYDLGALELACRALRACQNRKGLSRLYADARARMLEVGEVLPESGAGFLMAHPV